MDDWSSFEKDKKIHDAWSKFLKESQEIEEGFMDAVRGFKKGAKHGARSVLGLGPDEEDEIRSTGLAYKKPKTKKVDPPAAQTDGAQADTELPPEQPEPELQLKDLEATPPAKPGDMPDIYAGMSDEEMKAQQQTRNLSDRLQAMVDNYEKQGLPKSVAVKAAVQSAKAAKADENPNPTGRRAWRPPVWKGPSGKSSRKVVASSGVTFNDLEDKLTGNALGFVLKQVDKDDLTLALMTAPKKFTEKILTMVSSDSSTKIKQAMEELTNVPLSRIHSAQKRMLDAAIKLARDGSIYLPLTDTKTDKRAAAKKAAGSRLKKQRAAKKAKKKSSKTPRQGTVQRAGGSRGMPTQPQSRSRRNVRENINLTLKELIKEELLRVINEEE